MAGRSQPGIVRVEYVESLIRGSKREVNFADSAREGRGQGEKNDHHNKQPCLMHGT